jgi:hypothetical protein
MSLSEIAQIAARAGDPCLLCRATKTVAFGVYIASDRDAERGGVPRSQQALYPYTLCETCAALPEKERLERIENVALPMLMAGSN